MAANIQSLVNAVAPIIGASRDDLTVGDVVTVSSVDTATTYAWTLAYIPEGSAAAFSGDVLAQSPGNFTVDLEGPYLVRLSVDLGLPTESTQYVRIRYLTVLGSLELVAAGENNDGSLPYPIPVDNTPDGWADQQNFNLLTLLGFVQQCVSSGNVVYVDATPGYGGADTVQGGIDYAVAQGASATTPWVVAVRPGTYNEDVTFHPFAHVIAWPGAGVEEFVVRIVGTTGHKIEMVNLGDNVILRGLSMTSTDASGTTVIKTGTGSFFMHQCRLQQMAVSATAGPALDVAAGSGTVQESQLYGTTAAFADRFAVTLRAGALAFVRSSATGSSVYRFDEGTYGNLFESSGTATGPVGSLAVSSLAANLEVQYSSFDSPVGDSFQVNPAGTGSAGPVQATLKWSQFTGDIYFDTNAIAGATGLYIGSCEYDAITLPSGNPATLEATTKGTSLFYDNTATGITAENVQDAIDEVHALAIAVETLDDAYDGGVGGGIGRTIIADSGAVQVVDAAVPSDPPLPDNPDGRIQVVGGVEVGSIDKAEITLDPNPFGSGPAVSMGEAVWPGNAPYGGTAFVMAQSTGNPLYRNYGLRVTSQSTDGGGDVGRVLIRGGDGIQSGTTPDAAVVVMQGGSSTDAAVQPGDVALLPGSVPGSDGSVIIASLNGATPASVTASGAFVGGVAGTIRFGTEMGAIEVAIGAADNLATVLAAFTATGQVVAIDSGGGVIQISTAIGGPASEIYFLNDSVGGALDTALGQFDGQPMVSGNVTNICPIQATGPLELTIGGFGPNPLVYNALTGLLTVGSLPYTPSNLADWSGIAPTSVADALDRIAAVLTPIP